ncbi:unnamed protein product [Pleuronectes platessa]|uniref:Uncharacterized protein n=1 Tax=Pleuronectes platessa TaxID=8262 RepID=A0A9N7V005_PLEPL|nr:unnamed protein product [Pleuronectes platessa]
MDSLSVRLSGDDRRATLSPVSTGRRREPEQRALARASLNARLLPFFFLAHHRHSPDPGLLPDSSTSTSVESVSGGGRHTPPEVKPPKQDVKGNKKLTTGMARTVQGIIASFLLTPKGTCCLKWNEQGTDSDLSELSGAFPSEHVMLRVQMQHCAAAVQETNTIQGCEG